MNADQLSAGTLPDCRGHEQPAEHVCRQRSQLPRRKSSSMIMSGSEFLTGVKFLYFRIAPHLTGFSSHCVTEQSIQSILLTEVFKEWRTQRSTKLVMKLSTTSSPYKSTRQVMGHRCPLNHYKVSFTCVYLLLRDFTIRIEGGGGCQLRLFGRINVHTSLEDRFTLSEFTTDHTAVVQLCDMRA